ncbi:lytic transglycosylase domain-containing protein [Desulfonatronum thioautotrophicum]|uniref:lytic transglycosylase domain-containing protein n=1 Tax=Desulfonatronum thioautotrophicum TaxID=617001 RepID=UPI0005EB3D6C|nr:lytic transglycosylase domain-containing protein [Desulfonatronum thioautotrophicum]
MSVGVRKEPYPAGTYAGGNLEKPLKTLYSGNDGCQDVTVSAPRFRAEDGELLMETQVHLRHGRSIGNYCLLPLRFNGMLVMYQRPSVSAEEWVLHFTPVRSELRTLDGQPARLASLAWRLVEDHVLGSLAGITVNLGPPKRELQDFLPMMLTAKDRSRVLEMLRDLRPGQMLIQDHGLRLENVLTVFDDLYQPEPERLEAYLSDEELKRFIVAWEVWDAFLIHLITTLATRELTESEHALLLDVLLRLRHEFIFHLDDPLGRTDLVRAQFMEAWTRLGPLFRGHRLMADNDSLLGYLAFFSASDALLALDKLGPTLGMEISREGLIRLATLLGNQETHLEYAPDLLPELRRGLGLDIMRGTEEDTMQDRRQDNDQDNIQGDRQKSEDLGREEGRPGFRWSQGLNFLQEHFATFFIPAAQAASPPAGQDVDLSLWTFKGQNLDAYMARVTGLLRDRTEAVMNNSARPEERHGFFLDLVLAAAWQESCFRQFIKSEDRIIYLRSFNNTSVGIMQINERVWRGLYDQDRLRWDITYNAQAGAEILDLYYAKYARPRMAREPEVQWSADLKAGMLYAMYNGGPGQLERFLNRVQEGGLFRSDRLFQEKWDWVRQDDLEKISICLIGR